MTVTTDRHYALIRDIMTTVEIPGSIHGRPDGLLVVPCQEHHMVDAKDAVMELAGDLPPFQVWNTGYGYLKLLWL